ncbi:MAG TPA: hypothetical protein PLO51_03370 [Candidatus Micrarchaeota archaeon]|nr:hypothetical protein [Candidatus Micrarchaeota archaeon]
MKWHLIKDPEIVYQLRLAKLGNPTPQGMELCAPEIAYCESIGLGTGLKPAQNKPVPGALVFFKEAREAGRVGFFDHDDESLFFMFPPGNEREGQEIEYAVVICKKGKAEVARAVEKAIAIGKKTRHDAIVAICGAKSCEYVKLREMKFEPVSR